LKQSRPCRLACVLSALFERASLFPQGSVSVKRNKSKDELPLLFSRRTKNFGGENHRCGSLRLHTIIFSYEVAFKMRPICRKTGIEENHISNHEIHETHEKSGFRTTISQNLRKSRLFQAQRKPNCSTAKSAKDTKKSVFALFASFAVFSFGCGSAAPGVSCISGFNKEG